MDTNEKIRQLEMEIAELKRERDAAVVASWSYDIENNFCVRCILSYPNFVKTQAERLYTLREAMKNNNGYEQTDNPPFSLGR